MGKIDENEVIKMEENKYKNKFVRKITEDKMFYFLRQLVWTKMGRENDETKVFKNWVILR